MMLETLHARYYYAAKGHSGTTSMKKKLLFLPGPVTVAEPVLAAMSQPLIDHRGPQFAELLARIVARLQPIFGTESDIVLLGSSGTGGLEAAIAAAFGSGDTVLACPMGAFGRRMAAIARSFGCTVETLETPLGEALTAPVLERRLAAHSQRFAGILLTHNETSTGVQCDVERLAAVTRAYGALTVVYSVSGLGATPFRMDDWEFDVVVSASQKVLAAPPGVAMVAVSARAWEKMEARPGGSFYFDLRKGREFARIGQTPWTPPISTLFALDAALARYEEDGAPAAYLRHELYAAAIRAAFVALGMDIFSKQNAHAPTFVAASLPPTIDAAKVLAHMRDVRGVVLSGGQLELAGKIVRMGTMGDIAQSDILGALGALEIALLEFGADVRIGAGVQAALDVFLAGSSATRDAARTAVGRTAERTTAAQH